MSKWCPNCHSAMAKIPLFTGETWVCQRCENLNQEPSIPKQEMDAKSRGAQAKAIELLARHEVMWNSVDVANPVYCYFSCGGYLKFVSALAHDTAPKRGTVFWHPNRAGDQCNCLCLGYSYYKRTL